MTKVIRIRGKRYRWNITKAIKNFIWGFLGACIMAFYIVAFLIVFTGGWL